MTKIKASLFLVAVGAVVFLAPSRIVDADIPGVTLADTIDPSPGIDIFSIAAFKLNHTTHKLYAAGNCLQGSSFAIKVINTTSNVIIATIDLGHYTGSSIGFWPVGLEVDESATPIGDKVYVIGSASDSNGHATLRVIDGPSNTNLTGENTDLFLPFFARDFTGLAVNSTNHKIYVAQDNGEIVVVDGPNLQILRTLNPNFGNFVVADPVANKIFVVNHNGGGVINSVDDTFTPLSLFFTATAAVVDSIHGRIYFVGTALNNSNGIFAVDAVTGEVVASRTGLAAPPVSVALKADDNTLYVGSGDNLLAFDAADLTPRGSFARPAPKLVCDATLPASLFFVDYNQANSVLSMDPAAGVVATLTLGYTPFDIAINSRTNRIYVTDGSAGVSTNQLLVIDGSNHAVVARLPIIPLAYTKGGFKRHVAVSERLNRIYLPRNLLSPATTVIDVFDGGTNQFRGSIALDPTLGFYSDLVAVDDTRRRIYVTAARQVSTVEFDMTLVVYDADTEARIATVSLGINWFGGTQGLTANPVTGRVYASLSNLGVVIADGNTNTRVGAVSAGGQIVLNRRTNKVYVASPQMDPANPRVTVINGATDSLETTFPIQGENGIRLDVDEVTNRVYVAHTDDYILTGWLTAYDANNNYQSLGQIDLHMNAAEIAFSGTTRQLFVSNDFAGLISVFQDATAAPADLFGNISTRTYVGGGDNVLIGGFILDGSPSDTKRLMIRAIGPSLTQVGVTGALPDTTLEVHDASGNVTTNDNWKINDVTGSSQQAEIEATGIPPGNDLESALVMTLPAGQSVTAIVRGKDGAAGVGLVEVYDLNQGAPAKLVNISTRGRVDSGDNVMIAGVITVGSKSAQVVLRAIGPSLASSGVPNPLEDPVLELRDTNGGLITTNDDWQEHEADVRATMLAPRDSRESAIVAWLYPANYTAIARGKNGATGVALVEAYYLNQ